MSIKAHAGPAIPYWDRDWKGWVEFLDLDHDELIDKAIAAHLRWCKRTGHIPDQPSWSSSEVAGDEVILRNGIDNELCRYRVMKVGPGTLDKRVRLRRE